jgi:hypothetical protein
LLSFRNTHKNKLELNVKMTEKLPKRYSIIEWEIRTSWALESKDQWSVNLYRNYKPRKLKYLQLWFFHSQLDSFSHVLFTPTILNVFHKLTSLSTFKYPWDTLLSNKPYSSSCCHTTLLSFKNLSQILLHLCSDPWSAFSNKWKHICVHGWEELTLLKYPCYPR